MSEYYGSGALLVTAAINTRFPGAVFRRRSGLLERVFKLIEPDQPLTHGT
jgi:hypothetical protein